MEKQINVEELLKDCPTGMELDCTIYDGKVCFEGIDDNNHAYPIIISINKVNIEHLDSWGQYSTRDYAKCIIFPKGKTTWEGFVPPCQFKDGDIVAYVGNEGDTQLFIFKEMIDAKEGYSVCYLMLDYDGEFDSGEGKYYIHRLATIEEKERLFKAIKDNGYHWNAETKTLEGLVEPRFKVGDRVKAIYNGCQYDIKELTDTHYTLVEVEYKFKYTEPIIEDKHWELVPNKFDITTLKPFESRVLVRDSSVGVWLPEFFACLCDNHDCPYMIIGGTRWKCCIPFEGNEHLMCKTDDCDEYYKNWEK